MNYQNLDLKSSRRPLTRTSNLREKFCSKLSLRLLGASAAVILLGFSVPHWKPAAEDSDSNLKPVRLHYQLPLPETSLPATDRIKQHLRPVESAWKTTVVKAGDTLAAIFIRTGLPATTLQTIVSLNSHTKSLRYIKPGQKIHLLLDDQQQLSQMRYESSLTSALLIQRAPDQSFNTRIINYHLDALPVYRQGTIDRSLFEAAAKNTVPERIIMDLVNIFAWDIDFSLDIRRGDQFSIVYNELYRDGVKIRNGRVLAAEFINRNKTYRAVYYTDPKGNSGYYNENGQSLRKTFLRSPVEFSRISSRFSLNRWHPILSEWRAHKGVDYAAARGTPIRAAGDGKVTFMGTKSGYGEVIFIQHGGRYTTVYGHLERYAKGLRTGLNVTQGQVIGYVGSSGLATGPHLHYEFRVDGTHRNPLTVRLPEAKPVHPSYMQHFKNKTGKYLAMASLQKATLAANTRQKDDGSAL